MQDSRVKPFYDDVEIKPFPKVEEIVPKPEPVKETVKKNNIPIDNDPEKKTTKKETAVTPYYSEPETTNLNEKTQKEVEYTLPQGYNWSGSPYEDKINEQMWKWKEQGITWIIDKSDGSKHWRWDSKNSSLIDGIMSTYGIKPKEINITPDQQYSFDNIAPPLNDPEEKARQEELKAQIIEEGKIKYREQIKAEKDLVEQQRQERIAKGIEKNPVFGTVVQGTERMIKDLAGIGARLGQFIINQDYDPIQQKVAEDEAFITIGKFLGVDEDLMKAINEGRPRYNNEASNMIDYYGSFDYKTWAKHFTEGMNEGLDKISKAFDMKSPFGGKKTNPDDKIYDLIDGVTGMALTGLTTAFGILPKEVEEFTMLRITLATAVTKGILSKIPDNIYGESPATQNHVRRTKGLIETLVPLFLVGKKSHDIQRKITDRIDGKSPEARYTVNKEGKVNISYIPDIPVKDWKEFSKRMAEERQNLQNSVTELKRQKDNSVLHQKLIKEVEDKIKALDNITEKDKNIISQVVARIDEIDKEGKLTPERQLKEIKGRSEDPTNFPELKKEQSETLIVNDKGEAIPKGDIADQNKLDLITELETRIKNIDEGLTTGLSDGTRSDMMNKKTELTRQVEVLKTEVQEKKNRDQRRQELIDGMIEEPMTKEQRIEDFKEAKKEGRPVNILEDDMADDVVNFNISMHNIDLAKKGKLKELKPEHVDLENKLLKRKGKGTISIKDAYEEVINSKEYQERNSKTKTVRTDEWVNFNEDWKNLDKAEKDRFIKEIGIKPEDMNAGKIWNALKEKKGEKKIEKPISETELKTESPEPKPEEPIKAVETPPEPPEISTETPPRATIKPEGDNKAYSVLKALTEPENPLNWEGLKTALKEKRLGEMTKEEAKDLQKTLVALRQEGLIEKAGDVGYLGTNEIKVTPKGKKFVEDFNKKTEPVSKPVSKPETKPVSKPKTEEKPISEDIEDTRPIEEIHNEETLLKADKDKVEQIALDDGLQITTGEIISGNTAMLSGNEIKVSPDATYKEQIMGILHEVLHNKLNKREEKLNGELDPLYNNFSETIDNYIALQYPGSKFGPKEALTVTLTDILTLPNKNVSRGAKIVGNMHMRFNELLKAAQEELGQLPTKLNIIDTKNKVTDLNKTREFDKGLLKQALHSLGTYMGNKFKLLNAGVLNKIFKRKYDNVIDVFAGSGILSQILMDKVIKGEMEVGKFYMNDRSKNIYNFHKTMLNPEAPDLIKQHMAKDLQELFNPIAELLKAEREGKKLKDNKEFYEQKQGEMQTYWKENILDPLAEFERTGKSNLTPEELVAKLQIQVRFGIRGQNTQGIARTWNKIKWNEDGPFYNKNAKELSYHVETGDAIHNPFVNNMYTSNKRINGLYTHPKINLEITNKDIYDNGTWGLPENAKNGNNLIQADFPYLDTKEYQTNKVQANSKSLSDPNNPYAMEVRQKFADEFKDQHIVFFDSNHPKIEEYIANNNNIYTESKATQVGTRIEYMATNGKRLEKGEAEAITNPAAKVITNFVKVDPKIDPKLLDAISLLNPMFWVEQGKLTVEGYRVIKEVLTSPEFKAKMLDAYYLLRDTGKDIARNLGTAFVNLPYKILEKLPEWQKFITDLIKEGAQKVKGVFTGDISLTGGNTLNMLIGGEGIKEYKKGKSPAEIKDINKRIFKGLDGKDRLFISDYEMKIKDDFITSKDNTFYLKDAVEHKELFDLYPKMRTWKIKKDFKIKEDEQANINYDGGYTLIGINGKNIKKILDEPLNAEQLKLHIEKSIDHEIQHGVQKIEGHSPGTSPKSVISRLDKLQGHKVIEKYKETIKEDADRLIESNTKTLTMYDYVQNKVLKANDKDIQRILEIDKMDMADKPIKEYFELFNKIFPDNDKHYGRIGILREVWEENLLQKKNKLRKTIANAREVNNILNQYDKQWFRDGMRTEDVQKLISKMDKVEEGKLANQLYIDTAGEIESRIASEFKNVPGDLTEVIKNKLEREKGNAIVLKRAEEEGTINVPYEMAMENIKPLKKGEPISRELYIIAREKAKGKKLFREFVWDMIRDLGEWVEPYTRKLWQTVKKLNEPMPLREGAQLNTQGLSWRRNVPKINPKVDKSKKLTNLDSIKGISEKEKNKFLKSHGQALFAAVEKHLGTMNNESVTVEAIKRINKYDSPEHMMKSFLKRPDNYPTNNVEIQAIKIMRGNTFASLIDAYKAKDKSAKMKEVYADLLMDFLNWTEILRGHSATIARALQIQGIKTDIMEFMANPLNHGAKVEAFIKELTLQNFGTNFDALLKGAAKLEEAFTKPSIKDKGLYIFYNGLLGSLGVDVTNMTGNMAHLGWEFTINHSWNPYGYYDIIKGIGKGGKMAWDVIKGRRDELSKFDPIDLKAMQREPWRYGIDSKNLKLRIPGTIFRAAMIPTVRLEWQDAFFRSIGRQLMRGKVERKLEKSEFKFDPMNVASKEEQLKNFRTDMNRTIDRILADSDLLDMNSPKYIKLYKENPKIGELLKDVSSIDRSARHIVFQQQLGTIGKRIQAALRGSVGATLAVPFFRIGVNTTKASLQNSPIGLVNLSKKQIEAWTSGKKEIKNISDWHRQSVYEYSQLTAIEKRQQLRRGIAGTTLMLGLGYAMINGLMYITGAGPKNKADREAWEDAGFEPYRIYPGEITWDGIKPSMEKVNPKDKTGMSYQNLEHFGLSLAVLGEINDYLMFTKPEDIPEGYFDTAGTMLSLASFSSAKYFSDQSYMQTVKDLLVALEDKERWDKFLVRWGVRTATSSIPFIRAIEGTRKLITGDKTMYEKYPAKKKDESYISEMTKLAEHEFIKNIPPFIRDVFYPDYKLEKQFTALGQEKTSSYQKHILPLSGDIKDEAGAWLFEHRLRVNIPEWDKVEGDELRAYQLKSAKATRNFILKYKSKLDKDPETREKVLSDIQKYIHETIKENPEIKEFAIEKAVEKKMEILPKTTKLNKIFETYGVKSEKTGDNYYYRLSDEEKEAGQISIDRIIKLTDALILRTKESNLSSEEKKKRYTAINNAVRDAKKLF